MERTLQGRVAVVTGAGVRLGRAVAEGLGARGADVVVHFAHSLEGAEAAARAIRAGGARAELVQADLTQQTEIGKLFAAADRLGGCDLLVNSAAAFERRNLEEIDRAAWEKMLALDLSAPFFCCQAALPSMRRRGRGDVVNLVDIGGALKAWKGYAHYCSAKAGLAMLTRCLALELAPDIRVNAIAPGTVQFPEVWTEQERARELARIPLGREGSFADVLKALDYLLGVPYVTGQILVVDGGRSVG